MLLNVRKHIVYKTIEEKWKKSSHSVY